MVICELVLFSNEKLVAKALSKVKVKLELLSLETLLSYLSADCPRTS